MIFYTYHIISSENNQSLQQILLCVLQFIIFLILNKHISNEIYYDFGIFVRIVVLTLI